MFEPNNNPHRFPSTFGGRTLGVVQLRVGGRLFTVPVEAMDFASSDTTVHPCGGFFVQGDAMGIVVDQSATEKQMHAQVMEGCAEAVRHLSARYLN